MAVGAVARTAAHHHVGVPARADAPRPAAALRRTVAPLRTAAPHHAARVEAVVAVVVAVGAPIRAGALHLAGARLPAGTRTRVGADLGANGCRENRMMTTEVVQLSPSTLVEGLNDVVVGLARREWKAKCAPKKSSSPGHIPAIHLPAVDWMSPECSGLVPLAIEMPEERRYHKAEEEQERPIAERVAPCTSL